VLRYGGEHYKYLVPMFVVMFVFFLVLIAGWVFVAERRQGTLRRLQAAPLTRLHILMGKMAPCFALSVGQTLFLLIASRWLFGVRWGPDDWPLAEQLAWLLPVVLCTSLAAMGLALWIASVARSELQVAIYGGLLVLVLAVVGGCVLPREMMPENTQFITLLTPQGWALDAYRELLGGSENYQPNAAILLRSCGALAALGVFSLGLAVWSLRLE
jgi:ABC-type multidrug transport system permease subunit